MRYKIKYVETMYEGGYVIIEASNEEELLRKIEDEDYDEKVATEIEDANIKILRSTTELL